jgi:c-di-GMP-binding flagellar brake protein YcgR
MKERRNDNPRRNDRRIGDRRDIYRFIAVVEETQQHLVGKVSDLSTTGMCVVSENSIPVGNTIDVALEVIFEHGGTDVLHVSATSLWIRKTPKADTYEIGFEFIRLPPRAIRVIKELLREAE